MLFTDAIFLYFIIILFALYYLKPFVKLQVPLLILASFLFYYLNSHPYTILLLFSVLMNTFFSWKITRSPSYKARKTYVNIGVIINVFLLVFFKYGFMLVSSFLHEPSRYYNFFLVLALPIGISFFTFEGISLLVDTYKASNKPGAESVVKPTLNEHIKGVMLFISFFPHLIAGPILRANHFFPQLKSKYFKDIDFAYSFRKVGAGLFFKNGDVKQPAKFYVLFAKAVYEQPVVVNAFYVNSGFYLPAVCRFCGLFVHRARFGRLVWL